MCGSCEKEISFLGEMKPSTATEIAHFPPLPHNILLQTFNFHYICDPSAIHFSALDYTFPNALKMFIFYGYRVHINLQNPPEKLSDHVVIKLFGMILIPMRGN